ncbi:PAS domain S-box protein [Mariprofundus erugo]|uniref:histidine kinase n=1 Tax=Mariprofundus erugo TaxID=2528639 RepID=A0A5R9GRX2_9PROT|nr:PAS domain S-box protein [Mariprofundus erugo]TLS68650.1 PAS domain S-box protein [Mariprofundus erugo]
MSQQHIRELMDENQRLKDELARLRSQLPATPEADGGIQHSERHFRQLAECIGDAFWIVSPDWNQLYYISPAYEKIWGKSCQSLYENPHAWMESIVPDDCHRVAADIAIKSTGNFDNPAFPEYRIRRPDGSIRWILARAFPVRDHSGAICCISGIAEDISERKEAEAALLQSEARYKVLFEQTADYVFVLDPSSGDIPLIVDGNENAFKQHGYTRTELVGQPVSLIDPRATPEEHRQRTGRIKAGGLVHFEAEHQRRDGSTFFVDIAIQQVRFGDKELLYSVERDISERKQAENERIAYIDMLEGLQSVSDAINSPDPADKVIDRAISIVREIFSADRAWLLFPCDPDSDTWEVPVESTTPEYPGALSLKKRFPASDISTRIFNELLDSKHPLTYAPIPDWQKQGDSFDVRSQMAMAIRPRHGQPWVLGLHQCSHQRQWSKDEQRLFEQIGLRIADQLSAAWQEKMLRNLSSAVEQAGESVMITSREGTIEYVNPAFTAITGYKPEEVIGRDPSILKSDAQDPAYYQKLWQTITRGEVWSGTLIDRKKDGSFYPALMTIAPVHNEEGSITHFVATQQDISEHKRLQEQFFEAQKLQAIGTLAGGIAHDFNNMLAALQGNTFLAARLAGDDPKLGERLSNIDTIIQRAAAMVRQLLTYARKDHISMAPFTLNLLIKEGYKMARTAIPENIEYTCDLCPELMIVNGDANQLQQVLINLLINARDAVEETINPKISCSLTPFVADEPFFDSHPELRNRPLVRMSVRDNGCGISADKFSKIFEPFFTSKEVGKGTGLGLAMAYGSIKTHGGVIEVESELGRGTAFHVFLPLEKQLQATDLPKESHHISQGQSETVLLVDDEETLRSVSAEVLRDIGYTVMAACNGREALELLREHTIDLLITDIVMPEMGGIDLAEQVRRHRSSLPIIFVTGYNKDYTLKLQTGIDNSIVLNKPFEFGTLSQTIRQLLDGAA